MEAMEIKRKLISESRGFLGESRFNGTGYFTKALTQKGSVQGNFDVYFEAEAQEYRIAVTLRKLTLEQAIEVAQVLESYNKPGTNGTQKP